MLFWIILAIVVAFAIYVRVAPSDAARWHKQAQPAGVEPVKLTKGYIWRKVVEGDGSAELAALTAVAEADPRTTVLAGSAADGQVTFISRTAVIGFPDYTTMGIYTMPDGTRYLEVYGRLRFGRSDLGVNTKRIKGWLAAAQL